MHSFLGKSGGDQVEFLEGNSGHYAIDMLSDFHSMLSDASHVLALLFPF